MTTAFEIPNFGFSELWNGVAAGIPQFSAVAVGAATIGLAALGARVDGIVQQPCITGRPEAVRVMSEGISFAVAGGSVTKGALLTTAADGRVVTAVATNHILGRCLATAAAGEMTSVLLGYLGVA